MEGLGFETLQVLLILLPGFLSSAILSSLTVRKERTQLERVVEALVFSFVLYSGWLFLILRRPLTVEIERVNDKISRYSLSLTPPEFLWLFGFAIVLGLAMSMLITNDIPTKVLRWFKFTRLSTRASVWHDVFSDITRYVVLEFADGRRIIGWPRYVANTPDEGSLFLADAAWVLDNGQEIPIAGPGILVTKNMSILNILFLDAVPARGSGHDTTSPRKESDKELRRKSHTNRE